ncbi:hypothetical protein DSO57_1021745 [Entomophthora muscae]|uniref:Uncharacterized protein n=1 Tax=Entomophthora muscae TaxID=34485 RepID=A0ACC2S5H1_9FUNG|nr:hypothetical protein DSO57_1021745 [Entomophthora muscae]
MLNLAVLIVGFLVALWLSNVVYSVYVSPLKTIPSPFLLQLFPILLHLSALRGKRHEFVHQYHLKYGPIFRAGWRLIVIADGKAARQIHTTYKCTKGSAYDGFRYFGDNLLTIREREVHSIRRRLVGQAYSRPKVLEMESLVMEVGILPLLRSLEKEGEINLLEQFHFMGWDVIGKLGFGQSFLMLKDKGHPAVAWLQDVIYFSLVCTVFPLLAKFKVPSGEKLRRFSQQVLDSYNALGESTLLSHFLKATDKQSNQVLSKESILAETHLLLFAGTDTSSNTLALFFHLLLSNQDAYEKATAEVRACSKNGAMLSYDTINAEMPYLKACLKESMRVLPVVSGNLVRYSPKEGMTILGHHIPGGCELATPIYSIHRSPWLWDNPEAFMPERWIHDQTRSTGRLAESENFIPFLVGPRACIGKELALLEMHLACANILARFDLQLLPTSKAPVEFIALPLLKPKTGSVMAKVTLASIKARMN